MTATLHYGGSEVLRLKLWTLISLHDYHHQSDFEQPQFQTVPFVPLLVILQYCFAKFSFT